MFEYLIIMLIFTLPLILFAVYKRRFRALILAGIMGLVIGVPWDMISVHCFKTWSWNEDTLMGIRIGGLPLEEYLFMILVPMMLIGGALIFKIELHVGTQQKSKRKPNR
ncbi:MAG: lycopene cyclase domain-containing protein [Candidatus Bathyarchaeaceae archaeon]